MNQNKVENLTVYTKDNASFKSRITNVGTIIGIVSLVCLILTTTGILELDNTKVQVVTQCLCAIGVMLGVLNNPKGSGIYLPFIDYPVFGKVDANTVKNVLGSDVVNTIESINGIDPIKEANAVRDKLEAK